MEDVVSLILPKAEGEKEENQKLGVKELTDLQSKLMLVAGKAEKGKDEVERFSMVCWWYSLHYISMGKCNVPYNVQIILLIIH